VAYPTRKMPPPAIPIPPRAFPCFTLRRRRRGANFSLPFKPSRECCETFLLPSFVHFSIPVSRICCRLNPRIAGLCTCPTNLAGLCKSLKRWPYRRIAKEWVLGAGTMGSRIRGAFRQCRLPGVLRDNCFPHNLPGMRPAAERNKIVLALIKPQNSKAVGVFLQTPDLRKKIAIGNLRRVTFSCA